MADWLPQDFTYFEIGKALIPPLAGAFAGAWIAQRIAARNKVQDDLVRELRAIDLTMTIANGIADAYIGVKANNVKPMHDTWEAQHSRHAAIMSAATPQAPGVFEFDAEFRTLPPVKAPVDQLRELMFSGIVLKPHTVMLVNALDRCVDQNTYVLTKMNELADEFRPQHLQGEQLAAVYFGVMVGSRIDDRYPTTMRGLYRTTDDCIGFAKLLADDLAAHAAQVAAKLPEHLRGTRPVFDFSKAERKGLMPDPAEFAQWRTPTIAAVVPQAPTLCDRIKRVLDALSG